MHNPWWEYIKGYFLDFSFMYVIQHWLFICSPSLRFHCFGGCWDRSQDCCYLGNKDKWRRPQYLAVVVLGSKDIFPWHFSSGFLPFHPPPPPPSATPPQYWALYECPFVECFWRLFTVRWGDGSFIFLSTKHAFTEKVSSHKKKESRKSKTAPVTYYTLVCDKRRGNLQTSAA